MSLKLIINALFWYPFVDADELIYILEFYNVILKLFV